MAVHPALAADLMLINGRLLTMDSHNPVVQAVAVKDGKIVAVGDTAEVEVLAGATTQVLELDGRTAMPGLTDCHVHLASDSSHAVEAVECRDLYDPHIESVAALVNRIEQWAMSTPPGRWIVARGSPLADFRLHEHRLPTKVELDAAAPRNPTYISFGAHVIIANTLALQECLQIGGIKMSIDGGFTGKNAAFSEPIAGDGDHHAGLIRIQQDELDETVELYHALGMRICTHAIGDIAMDMILDAYAKALTRRPRQDHRHRVEHLGNWMMTPERVARAKQLGILPIANPPFLFFLGDPMVEMLQRRATEQGFPFRTLWDAGFPLSFGSDSPGYYPVDPLRDLGTAVAHQTLSGQKVNAGEALTCRRPCGARPSTPPTRASRNKPSAALRWGNWPTWWCSAMTR